jgi:hypothetical protein
LYVTVEVSRGKAPNGFMSAMCTRILGVSCGVIPDDWLLALVLAATPTTGTVLRVLSYSTRVLPVVATVASIVVEEYSSRVL